MYIPAMVCFEERSVLLTTNIIVVEASNVEKEYLSSED